MLIRNCEISKLIKEGDFNVRLTVFDLTKCSKDQQKGAWLEVIKDSIGGGILNSHDKVRLLLEDVNRKYLFSEVVEASKIPAWIRINCPKPMSLRITIASTYTNAKPHTWIVIV